MPGRVDKLVGFGTVAAGCGVAACGGVGLVSLSLRFPIDVRSLLVCAYTILMSLLLIFSALLQSERLFHHFGFLRYPAGTGALLVFAGALTFADQSLLGQVAGACALAWGGVCVAWHFWQSWSSPRNEPLLSPTAG